MPSHVVSLCIQAVQSASRLGRTIRTITAAVSYLLLNLLDKRNVVALEEDLSCNN